MRKRRNPYWGCGAFFSIMERLMKKPLSFALGNIWRWTKSKNRDVLIPYVRELDVSGIEITFALKEELYSFRLSEDNRSWLRSLDYVTIHAPFDLIGGSAGKDEVIRQLDIISALSDDVNAGNIIIHPDNLPPPEILKEYGFNVSTENLPPKSRISMPDLKRVLDRYPEIGLCLDVSHAYLWSKHETRRLVKAFKDRITQVHLSGTYKRKDHQSLRSVTRAFLYSIQPVKELNVPIVIEEDIETKSLRFVKKEIDYALSILQTG